MILANSEKKINYNWRHPKVIFYRATQKDNKVNNLKQFRLWLKQMFLVQDQ